MQAPFPGPNVMLPALRLSDTPDLDHCLAFKRREAEWKRLVSNSHREWCLCGSYLNHFLPAEAPLKSCTEDEKEDSGDVAATSKEDGVDGMVEEEEDFVAGLIQPG
nr:ORF2 [Torque teno felis virus]